MGTRTGHIGLLPLTRDRSAQLRKVLIALLVLAGVMLYVAGKVQIIRLGYQIDGLEQQKRDLERMNRSLQIEASSLSASGRIEQIAIKKLGMVRPSKENIVVVRRRPKAAGGGAGRAPAR